MSGACVLTSVSFFGNGSNPTFAIVGLSLYLSFFSLGTGPGAWLIPSEIFATSIRAKAMSLASFSNRITATLMATTFLSTANGTYRNASRIPVFDPYCFILIVVVLAIGWGPFFVMLAAISVVVLIFLYFLLPETKGRSLEDMSLYFAEITGDNSILEAEKKILSDRHRLGNVEMTESAVSPPIPTGESA
jgi:hypothetical protein